LFFLLVSPRFLTLLPFSPSHSLTFNTYYLSRPEAYTFSYKLFAIPPLLQNSLQQRFLFILSLLYSLLINPYSSIFDLLTMIQEDFPKEQVQALRSVHKNLPLNVAALTSANDEIFHVEIHPDPETQKEIVLWDDILQAFNNAVQVRHKTKVVPFLKGKDFTM
jgi:hypothetical protein